MRIGGVENFSFFESAVLEKKLQRIFFFLHPHENQSKFFTPAQRYTTQCIWCSSQKVVKINVTRTYYHLLGQTSFLSPLFSYYIMLAALCLSFSLNSKNTKGKKSSFCSLSLSTFVEYLLVFLWNTQWIVFYGDVFVQIQSIFHQLTLLNYKDSQFKFDMYKIVHLISMKCPFWSSRYT